MGFGDTNSTKSFFITFDSAELPKHESWDLIPRKSKKVMVHRLIFDCLGLEGHSLLSSIQPYWKEFPCLRIKQVPTWVTCIQVYFMDKKVWMEIGMKKVSLASIAAETAKWILILKSTYIFWGQIMHNISHLQGKLHQLLGSQTGLWLNIRVLKVVIF